MDKYRAIPQGYMTVGEVAKKMGVTVRTMQYYDKEKLIEPSALSEGGRRLYTDKDMVKLHQVLSLKSLGFSLGEIKNRLILLDTPGKVAAALQNEADLIEKKMTSLTESLQSIKALKAEVLQMKTVDFKKYADIIVNLQMKNEHYWFIKYFDDKTLDHIRMQFTQESGKAFMNKFHLLWNEAIDLQKKGVLPSGKVGQDFAERFWGMITEFTGGNMGLVSKLMEFAKNSRVENEEWKQQQDEANAFLQPALDAYFDSVNIKINGEDEK